MTDGSAISTVRPAEGTQLFVLESAGIFFSESRQELHTFNTAATLLWCSLEDGLAPDDIASVFARTFDVPLDRARQTVVETLRHWRQLGYITGQEPQPAMEPAGVREPTEPRPRHPPGSPRDLIATSPIETRLGDGAPGTLGKKPSLHASTGPAYRFLTTTFSMGFANDAQEAMVRPIFAHLQGDKNVEVDVALDILDDGAGGQLLQSDGAPAARCTDLDQLGALTKATLQRIAINRHHYFMQIHAGAVFDGHLCILLPGVPGSGKTTLTAALIHAGFQYLSDEVTLLDAESLRLHAAPLSLTIKPGALHLLSDLYPTLRTLRTHRREDGEMVRYLNPPRASLPRDPERSYPVASIVFPRYAPHQPTSLTPIGRTDALHRLMQQCLSLPGRLKTRQVVALVQWIRRVRCFDLSMSCLTESVRLVKELTRWTRAVH